MGRADPIRGSIAASSNRYGASWGTRHSRHSRAKSFACPGTNQAQEGHMGTNLPASHAKQVADFLQKARTVRGRLAFIIDATGSREHAWDAASQLQAEMFVEAGKFGTLEMEV